MEKKISVLIRFHVFILLFGSWPTLGAGKVVKSNLVRVSVVNELIGLQDFSTRCKQPGVIRCIGFDSASEVSGSYGSPTGILPGSTTPFIDTSEKASGAGSLKFTINSPSPANAAGSYFANFSDDLSVQFGENANFFVQYRQKLSPSMLQKFLSPAYGYTSWKQSIIGTGDKPGCSPSNSGSLCASSCTELEVVVQNILAKGFPQMYNSCTGSTSHSAYDPFSEAYGPYDFKLQNAMPSPFCLYSQSKTSYFSPTGNCLGYSTDEWMSFQIEIKTGPRVGDEFSNSFVKLWVGRQGQASQLVINWGPYNLTAGSFANNYKFGKVWLLPYMSEKDSTQIHNPAYTWYDELIISRNKIADPK